jgi:hypothetical protein
MDIFKENGNELHGTKTGDGWERCSHPITNEEVFLSRGERRLLNMITSEFETCPACGGSQNMILGYIGRNQYSRCRDCWTPFVNREALDA